MKFVDTLSVVFLIVAGLVGVLVAALDLLGTDLENGPWAWVKGPRQVTLLIVAILAISIGLERWARFRSFDKSLEEIHTLVSEGPTRVIRALNGADIDTFENVVDLLKYATKKMRAARMHIDDMSLGSTKSPNVRLTQAYKDAYTTYRKTITSVSSKKSLQYRELVSFPPLAHFERIREILSKDPSSYRIRYLIGQMGKLPPFNVMIIDAEQIIIYYPPSEVAGVAIKHPQIADSK